MIYQCNLSACKNADRPSISTRIPIVNTAQAAKTAHNTIKPYTADVPKPIFNTMCHNTSDNSN